MSCILQPHDTPKCSPQYISILRDEWRQVFIIAAEVYVAGTILYAILGSGKTQFWAIYKDNDVITTSSSTAHHKTVNEEEKVSLLSDSKPARYGYGTYTKDNDVIATSSSTDHYNTVKDSEELDST